MSYIEGYWEEWVATRENSVALHVAGIVSEKVRLRSHEGNGVLDLNYALSWIGDLVNLTHYMRIKVISNSVVQKSIGCYDSMEVGFRVVILGHVAIANKSRPVYLKVLLMTYQGAH